MAATVAPFDLVVVGCGIAGLSAAATALQAGARVAILERSVKEERGGQTRWTEALLRMKSESEPSDDFEAHLANNAGHYLDPELIAETARDRDNWSSIVKTLGFTDPEVIATFAALGRPDRGLAEKLRRQVRFPADLFHHRLPAAHGADRRRAGSGRGAGRLVREQWRRSSSTRPRRAR